MILLRRESENMQDQQESFPSLVFGRSVVFESNTTRVAEVGSLSCTAKNPTKSFVERVFANFRDSLEAQQRLPLIYTVF